MDDSKWGEYYKWHNYRVWFTKQINLGFEPRVGDQLELNYPEPRQYFRVTGRRWSPSNPTVLSVYITGDYCSFPCEVNPQKMKTAGWKIASET